MENVSGSGDLASARVRAEAARAVARVQAGRTLDAALDAADTSGLTAQNRSLMKALAYGVVREHTLLQHLVRGLLQKPLKDAPEVESLLLCGVHQLRAMRMPAHAAVTETVNAVVLMGAHWAKGLTNAVLRRYQRERAALEAALPTDPTVRQSHPAWLVDALRRDWPGAWKTVLAANNEPGPLTLRVNRRQQSAAEWLARLPGAGLTGARIAGVPDAVRLDEAVTVDKLPGFADGVVSVQDASAQLAADLLDLRDGLRVLDACAAPGGKSAHVLERAAVELTALDVDAGRAGALQQTLTRLKLAATVKTGDARDPQAWWDGKAYDRILLDAPCSGTGVIRRHPDIKWLRRATDIPRMAQAQSDMLAALWPLLAPGGTLVYAVCSTLKAEADEVIARFRESTAGAKLVQIRTDWGEPTHQGRRLAPGGDWDGFFYAKLQK